MNLNLELKGSAYIFNKIINELKLKNELLKEKNKNLKQKLKTKDQYIANIKTQMKKLLINYNNLNNNEVIKIIDKNKLFKDNFINLNIQSNNNVMCAKYKNKSFNSNKLFKTKSKNSKASNNSKNTCSTTLNDMHNIKCEELSMRYHKKNNKPKIKNISNSKNLRFIKLKNKINYIINYK